MATQYTAGLTTGQVLTAATMNSIGATWESFTCAWTGSITNPAIGNGSITASYAQINKLLIVSVIVVSGTTTTFGSGNYKFSMPVSIVQGQPTMGWGVVLDASAGYASYNANTIISTSATTVELYTTNGLTPIGAASPVTFAANDQIRFTIVGQAL